MSNLIGRPASWLVRKSRHDLHETSLLHALIICHSFSTVMEIDRSSTVLKHLCTLGWLYYHGNLYRKKNEA